MAATLTTVYGNTGTTGVAIAYDYSPYLERIATALESIASSTGTASAALVAISSSTKSLLSLTTGSGIKTVGPFDYMESVYLFNWFLDQKMPLNTASITTTNFTNLIQDINTLSNAFPRYL